MSPDISVPRPCPASSASARIERSRPSSSAQSHTKLPAVARRGFHTSCLASCEDKATTTANCLAPKQDRSSASTFKVMGRPVANGSYVKTCPVSLGGSLAATAVRVARYRAGSRWYFDPPTSVERPRKYVVSAAATLVASKAG